MLREFKIDAEAFGAAKGPTEPSHLVRRQASVFVNAQRLSTASRKRWAEKTPQKKGGQ